MDLAVFGMLWVVCRPVMAAIPKVRVTFDVAQGNGKPQFSTEDVALVVADPDPRDKNRNDCHITLSAVEVTESAPTCTTSNPS